MDELWKEIGDGSYSISNMGKVKNNRRGGRLLTTTPNHNGYLVVGLGYEFGGKQFRLSRLVAQAFIPNVGMLPEVNHIDGNKKNNGVENLEWVTSSQNEQHALSLAHFPQMPVVDSRGNVFRSIREASRITGADSSSISKVCRGIYRSTKGEVFSYVR